MIKFFQRIRRKLIDERNVKRYLVYASGEILLVMIGILLALQVNNWNNNRLNRQQEKINLQAISEKMKLNQFQSDFGIQRYKDVINAAEEILRMISDVEPNYSKNLLEKNLHILTKRWLLGKSNSTSIYDELIGSGQLSNISSPQLRNRLTALKSDMELLESYEDLQIHFVDNFLTPYLNQYVDKISVGKNGAKTDTSFYDKLIEIDYPAFSKRTVEDSYETLVKSQEFSNLLIDLIKHTKTLLPIYDRVGVNILVIDSLAAKN